MHIKLSLAHKRLQNDSTVVNGRDFVVAVVLVFVRFICFVACAVENQ